MLRQFSLRFFYLPLLLVVLALPSCAQGGGPAPGASASAALPPLYVRWTNTGTGEPYCLFTFVHGNGKPWYTTPGMLTANGFEKGYFVPRDKQAWIGPGQSTPWTDL